MSTLYFFFGHQPALWRPTVQGGAEALAYDFESGELVAAPGYLLLGYMGDTDMEEVDAPTFNQRLAALRAERQRKRDKAPSPKSG